MMKTSQLRALINLGVASPFIVPFDFAPQRDAYRWTQKTPYLAPEPDHAAHIARAEEKRLRKAVKLARSTHPTGGSNHGE